LVLFAQEGNISLTVLPKKWLPPFWRKKQEQFIARIIEPDDWLYETNFFDWPDILEIKVAGLKIGLYYSRLLFLWLWAAIFSFQRRKKTLFFIFFFM
jgi:hypothetical protein